MKKILYTLACLLLSVGAWAEGEVAQIGETKYAKLADAIAAVPKDGTATTITMLADADIDVALTIANTQNVVIDLNGKAVKNDASKALAQLITVNGKLTINDSSEPSTGVIKNTASGKYVIKTGTAASVLTLNNGTIETTTGNSNGAVYGTYGSFVMTGGKIIAAGTGVTSKNVTISGGEITATAGQALCAAGTITGGTFASTNNSAAYASQSGTLEITGGTFTGVSSKPTINVNTTDVKVTGVTLANGVGFVSNATAMLLPGTDDAYLTNTQAEFYDGETLLGYAPINTGLFASSKVSGKTVKLTKDVATTTYLNVTKSFTLDLNGHNIACTPAKADATILTKGTASAPVELTIKGEGKISCADHGEGCNAIQLGNYSAVNIEGGEFFVPGDNSTIYMLATVGNSVVNISDGKFESGDGKYVLNIKDDCRAYNKFNVTGGTFVGFNPADNNTEGANTSFVAEGYEAIDNGDGTFTIKKDAYVAQVGENKYESLTAAIEAAQNGETVTLLADVIDNIVIPAGKNITLDLNGKTLSGGSVASNGKKAAIVNNGTITIQDSSAEQTGTIKREDDDTDLSASNSYYVIDNQGTMTIKSGNVINNSGVPGAHKGSSLIRNGEVAEGAVLNIEGGTLTQNNFDVIKNGGKNSVLNITGGTINSANSYAILSYDKVNMSAGTVTGKVCLRSYDSDYAVANITGGTINGNITVETYPGNTPDKLSECNISGDAVINGTLSIGEGNGKTFTANDEKGTIAVSGGTFSSAVPEKYCADGYVPTPNADGTYGVVAGEYVAEVDGKKYASLADAVAQAGEGDTVTLLVDITLTSRVEPNKSMTIDLNGKTITTTATCGNGSAFDVKSGTVVIKNGSIDGTGVTETECDAITSRSGSDVTLQDLNIIVKSKNGACAYAFNGSKITVESGYYENKTTEIYQYNPNISAMVFNQANYVEQLIFIKGGTFKGFDPAMGDDSQIASENHTFLAPGFYTEKNSDGAYVLVSEYIVTDGIAFKTIAKPATVANATYTRTMPAGTKWGTVCVPFTLKSGNGTDAPKLYTFKDIDGSTLNVEEIESAEPGTPVIFYCEAANASFTTENAKVNTSDLGEQTGPLVGTYESTKITSGLDNIYFINGDKFHQAKASLTVPGYRAYIVYSGMSGSAKPSVLSLSVSESTTGINAVVDNINTTEAIYDINGRQLSAPQKGVNIMKLANGKTVKLFIK